MDNEKMPQIYGVRKLEFQTAYGEVPTVTMELAVGEGFNPNDLYYFKGWDDYFPGDVVVKCQFCGQWGARKTACGHCGGAIE